MEDDFLDAMLGEIPADADPAFARYERRRRRVALASIGWVQMGRGVPLLFAIADRMTPESQADVPLLHRQSHHRTIYEWLTEARSQGFEERHDNDELWTWIIDAAMSTEEESVGDLEWASEEELDRVPARYDAIVEKWRTASVRVHGGERPDMN